MKYAEHDSGPDVLQWLQPFRAQYAILVESHLKHNFRSGARIRDAFGRRFTIYALNSIGGISEENAARFTSFLINDCRDIGRLIQFDE